MAYYIRRGLVEENKDFIEQIHSAVTSGRALTLPCNHVVQIPRLRNWVNKLLRACTMLPEECNGKYTTLRSLVTVSDDNAGPSVIVKPKEVRSGYAFLAPASNPTERDVLRVLAADTEQDVMVLSFHASPSYQGDEWMETEGSRLGYDITLVGEDGGPLACVAKRRPKAGAFDLLKRSGYTTS